MREQRLDGRDVAALEVRGEAREGAVERVEPVGRVVDALQVKEDRLVEPEGALLRRRGGGRRAAVSCARGGGMSGRRREGRVERGGLREEGEQRARRLGPELVGEDLRRVRRGVGDDGQALLLEEVLFGTRKKR